MIANFKPAIYIEVVEHYWRQVVEQRVQLRQLGLRVKNGAEGKARERDERTRRQS